MNCHIVVDVFNYTRVNNHEFCVCDVINITPTSGVELFHSFFSREGCPCEVWKETFSFIFQS